jgi:cysteine synthase
MSEMIPGPTYQEMLRPAHSMRPRTELDPLHLFGITWRASDHQIRHVVLPKELTGVEANIVVLLGNSFPSGSHKVGPAYATLMEGELAGEIEPGKNTIIGPSTGNFGIGVAYIARLKGYSSVVIMPDGMSRERYERIQRYGGKLDLTPGTESDVILVLERTEEYKKDPSNKVLAQFELLPNYRFHRYVTGRSALEAAQLHGNGRVAAFVSAPGSAGTLAAGDEIKARFPEAVVCALEPKECSTLFNNGRGTHRIEGIGDKMVALIHNVLTTDYVQLIHDDDCVAGLDLIQRDIALVERLTGMAAGTFAGLRDLFGISGICNVLGAIRLARYLRFGHGDNVVTIATDGFDRYPSVLDDLDRRAGPIDEPTRTGWFESIFRGADTPEILDVRPREQKERLFAYKEQVWTGFGYTRAYLERMQSQSFWDAEYERIEAIDRELTCALSSEPAART